MYTFKAVCSGPTRYASTSPWTPESGLAHTICQDPRPETRTRVLGAVSRCPTIAPLISRTKVTRTSSRPIVSVFAKARFNVSSAPQRSCIVGAFLNLTLAWAVPFFLAKRAVDTIQPRVSHFAGAVEDDGAQRHASLNWEKWAFEFAICTRAIMIFGASIAQLPVDPFVSGDA